MGFIIPKAKQITVQLNGDYKGAEFTCITKPSMATMIAITMGDTEDIAAPMMSFGDLVLVSWNLETDEGEVEANGDGMLSLDADLSGAILTAWSDEVANPKVSASE